MMAFAEAGIHLREEREGKHRLACPECDKGRHDTALEVTITPKRWAFWECYRCGWEGKAPLDAAEPLQAGRENRHARIEVVDPPSFHHTLSPQARALWQACRPIAENTPAAVYFLGRGCALPEHDVRWHPGLRHPSGHVGPGIVMLITDAATAEPINLHRTWIKADGSGKAELDKPRLLLSAHRKQSGVVRLVEDAEVTTGLCIGEGLETCLSAMWGFSPVWCVIDAGNLAAFPVLAGIEALTILADHDRPNRKTGKRTGLEAAQACAERWLEHGAEVGIWTSPVEGQDFNDTVAAA